MKVGKVRKRSPERGIAITVLPWEEHGYRIGWILRLLVGSVVFYAATNRGAESAWKRLRASEAAADISRDS